VLRPFDVKDTPVVVDHGCPTEPLQTLLERAGAIQCISIVLTGKVHKANAHAAGLLRTRSKRPCGCGSADKLDELPSKPLIASALIATSPVSVNLMALPV